MRSRTNTVTAAAALLLAAACGGEPVPQTAAARGPLEAAFAEASSSYGVPEVVLEAIGKVETQWFHEPYRRSIDGGFGLMHLTESSSIPRAAKLSGFTEDQLKSDARANILGAAAVLRDLFDETYRADATLDARNPADFWRAVELYSGLQNPELARDYAEEVFATILSGAERTLPAGERVVLPATPVDLSRHPVVDTLRSYACPVACPDYPTARWVAANPANYGTRTQTDLIDACGTASPCMVVIHTTQGTYSGSIAWFQDPAAQASAHFVVPAAPHSPPVTQMVAVADKAWHTGVRYYNNISVGIENEGYIDDPSWATENIYCEASRITRWLCDSYHFTCDRAHVIGHVEVPGATHTDPGQYWNWTHFMDYVAGGCGGTGVLTGAIYKSPNTSDRLAGATVSLNTGQSAVTGSDGMYRFSVAAGVYTITAQLSGYKAASVSRTAVINGTVWGSMGLVPADAATGKYLGVVYELNPADLTDKTKRLEGATVTLDNGATATSRATDGYFEFAVDEGPHSATATLAGYKTGSSTATVVAGGEAWGSIGLTAGAAVLAPTLTLEQPLDGQRLDSSTVDVSGLVGNATDVAEVLLTVGNAAALHVPIVNARFQTTVTVPVGDTVLHVHAQNDAGAADVSATVHFATGVCGFVHESWLQGGGQQARISGATVEFLADQSCVPMVGTTTQLDGSFCLDAAPGTYRLRARASGHQMSIETITVPADARATAEFALVQGSDPEPNILITSPRPKDGGKLTASGPTLDVSGSVGGVTLSQVMVNGRKADLSVGGTFVVRNIPINAGETAVVVEVEGTCGERASRTFTAEWNNQPGDDPGPCGCASGGQGAWVFALAAVPGVWLRRRKG